MTITQNVNPDVYDTLPHWVFKQVDEYINHPMTATWINERETTGTAKKKEVITAELMYYSMIAHNVPMECQKWHLNRLIMLLRVCNIKNQPPQTKKMGRKEMYTSRSEINRMRRMQNNTKG
jgi:hypothetical protein